MRQEADTAPIGAAPSRPSEPADDTTSPFPRQRVVIFALGARSVYRPVLYSTNEVFLGPDATDAARPDGRPAVVRTPVGVYDGGAVARAAGIDLAPDLVVVKADATGRSFPINLDAFPCPRVLVVGNTQHLESPIRRLLAYARKERFDFVTTDHKRHHLHFFEEAGFPNVAWHPALNVNPHRQPWTTDRAQEVVFVGQVGKFHPYRTHVLAALADASVPLRAVQAPQAEAARLYACATISLNCSLNGDLNLRVFEVLAAGGFLLTDRLAPESGLGLLFDEGRHYEAYADAAELVAKARYYLAHPDEAAAIARAGCEAFWRAHRPERKAAALLAFARVARAASADVAAAAHDARAAIGEPAPGAGAGPRADAFTSVSARAAIYEHVQQLHLDRASVRALVAPGVDARVVADLVDLPRLCVAVIGARADAPPATVAAWRTAGVLDRVTWTSDDSNAAPGAPWDALVLRGDEGATAIAAHLLDAPAFLVILAAPAAPEAAARVACALGDLGFAQEGGDARFFGCRDPNRLGQALVARASTERALGFLAAAVNRHPGDPDWLTDCATLAIRLGERDLAELGLRAALELRPTHGHGRAVLTILLRHGGRDAEAARLTEVRDLFPRGVSIAPVGALLRPKRILVINNLFPPQELGGYGRLLSDFAALLGARGHEIRVLSSDTDYLGAKPAHEPGVERTLSLYGGWRNGVTHALGTAEASRLALRNVEVVREVVRRFRPDACLLGNIDFVGHPIIAALTQAGVPVLHHLGNAVPGYAAEDTPTSPLYRPLANSVWLARKVAAAGYPFASLDVVYPGALVHEFFTPTLPARDQLRIAYASIVLPYKGVQVLVDALGELNRRGVPFSSVIAGTTTNPAYLDTLRAEVAAAGMSDKVTFAGFLDRAGLKRLFATHNVLAFPSLFDEPFGISQVEAMAAGMTVVSSGTGGAVEVIEHERSGLLAARGNSVAWAAALASLPADPARWRRLAEAGRERAVTFFDIRRSVDQLEEAFAQLLGAKLELPPRA